jgi:hypothetical protein
MSNVPVKVASVFFLGAAAGAVWTMLPQRAVLAADNCVTVPTDQTPQGQHWYYHIERGTGRHCWYLRGGDDKSARTEETPVAATPEQPAPRHVEASPSRSISDAHAEIPPRARVAGETPAAAPSVWPSPASAPPPASAGAARAPVGNEPAPSLASRWPQTSGTSASGTSASAASGTTPTTNQPTASQQPLDASLMLADVQTADATRDAADSLQTPPPALAVRNNGSVQKLLLVAAGALALAGLTGSAVYRLGRRRRRNDWLRERSAQNPNTPPWLEPGFAHANSIPDLDEARLAAQQSDFSLAMDEGDQTADRVEQIEEYLARLTRQLQDEVKSSNARRAEPDGRRVVMAAPHGEEAPSAVPDIATRRGRENHQAAIPPSSFETRAKARSSG